MSSKKKGKRKAKPREEELEREGHEERPHPGALDVTSDMEVFIEDYDGAHGATVYSKSFSYGISGHLLR